MPKQVQGGANTTKVFIVNMVFLILIISTLGLFIHSRRLSMDKNAPATTTYPRNIPAGPGLARHFRDIARPRWHRPSGPHLVPCFVASPSTEAGPDGPELSAPYRMAGSSSGETYKVSSMNKG